MAARTQRHLHLYLSYFFLAIAFSKNSIATTTATTHYRQIALDVVGVLLQVESMPPGTTLQMQPPEDIFGATLGHFLKEAGYTVTLNDHLTNAHAIEYFTVDNSSEQNTIKTYQVNIGKLKFRRDYKIESNMAQPQSTVYLRGANASAIRLNDEIFNLDYVETYGDSEIAHDEQAPVQLSVQTIDTRQSYNPGEAIALSVSINYEAKVYCYYKDGHGQIVRIFPNRFTSDNHVNPGQKLVIPATDNWSINATRVDSTDDFLCIATGIDNEHLISILNNEPDLEPLAARSLEHINEKVTADPNAPVITSNLTLKVNY